MTEYKLVIVGGGGVGKSLVIEDGDEIERDGNGHGAVVVLKAVPKGTRASG